MRFILLLFGYCVLAALFFSSTFLLNRLIGIGQEHWFWTASLRFLHMFVLLYVGLRMYYPRRKLLRITVILKNNLLFWIIAGTVGYGLFYFPLCVSAEYIKGWATSAFWQLTIVATPIVLFWVFWKNQSWKPLIFSAITWVGIFLVALDQAEAASLETTLKGGLPVVFAAFMYPIGNQMVRESKRGGFDWLGGFTIPSITDDLIENPFVQIFLLTVGSIPFWFVLGGVVQASGAMNLSQPLTVPSWTQIAYTFLVALCSGVIATSLFYEARNNMAENSYQVAMVDSTQSGEAIFTLIGEIIFLNIALPTLGGWSGLVLIIAGITIYFYFDQVKAEEVAA